MCPLMKKGPTVHCPVILHDLSKVHHLERKQTVYFVSLRFLFCLDIWRKWSPQWVCVLMKIGQLHWQSWQNQAEQTKLLRQALNFICFRLGTGLAFFYDGFQHWLVRKLGQRKAENCIEFWELGVKEWKRLGNIWLAARNWFDCECLSWCLSEHGEMKRNGLVSILWWLEFLKMDLFRMFGLKRLRMETILSSGKPLRKQKGYEAKITKNMK